MWISCCGLWPWWAVGDRTNSGWPAKGNGGPNQDPFHFCLPYGSWSLAWHSKYIYVYYIFLYINIYLFLININDIVGEEWSSKGIPSYSWPWGFRVRNNLFSFFFFFTRNLAAIRSILSKLWFRAINIKWKRTLELFEFEISSCVWIQSWTESSNYLYMLRPST